MKAGASRHPRRPSAWVDKKGRIRYVEVPPAGIEPTISCSVGRRLIHWATGAELLFVAAVTMTPGSSTRHKYELVCLLQKTQTEWKKRGIEVCA